MNEEFNKWWDKDDLTTDNNNFVDGTPAYWAWEGWCAAVKAEREACAKVAKEHAAEYKVGGELYTMLGMNTSKPAEAACDHIAHLIHERGNT